MKENIQYTTNFNSPLTNFRKNVKSFVGLVASLLPFPPILIAILHRMRGVKINKINKVFFSYDVYLDGIFPEFIEIGEEVYLTRGVKIITHFYPPNAIAGILLDGNRTSVGKVVIGDNVFVGVNSIILPGVTIGDNVVIGAGSVVTSSILSNQIAAGNTSRVIRELKYSHGV